MGPAPITANVRQASRSASLVGGFRLLERGQHAAPDQERVVERLEAGRELLPLIVAEVGVRGAARDEQIVVGNLRDRPATTMRAAVSMPQHLAHVHGDVALVAQDVAQRRGDRRRREPGGGHLVEQGLEQMMVAAIDQRDLDRRALELAHGPEPGESAADDDDSSLFLSYAENLTETTRACRAKMLCSFEFEVMKTIKQQDLIDSVADALQYISYFHPPDYIRALGNAYELEQSPAARDAIAQILTNSRMCAEGRRPICQDTGIVMVFAKVGMNVRWDAHDRASRT